MCSSTTVDSVGCDDTKGKTTLEMQAPALFLSAGWDLWGEVANGTYDVWMIYDGTGYPKLTWEAPIVIGDLVCPIGVATEDLEVLANQWLLALLTYDVAPGSRDGLVNWLDFAMLSGTSELAGFTNEWLETGAVYYDIAPNGGDGFFDLVDFSAMAGNWMAGI
jgi:hypothetical protein